MRAALIALVLAFPAHARVLDMHAEIRVAKSGELTVVERVTLGQGKVQQKTYRVPGRIVAAGDHDALHWHLKGAERMTAEVLLPASVPARDIKLTASGAEFRSFVGDGRAAFRAEAPIAIVVRFPKGVVDTPQRDWFGLGLLALILISAAWVLHRIRGQGANSART